MPVTTPAQTHRVFASLLLGAIIPIFTSGTFAFGGELELPPPAQWERRSIQAETTQDGVELRLVEMFQPAGLVSPTTNVEPGKAVTLSATVETIYRPRFGYYLFWIELQFLSGEKVLETVRSSFIRGTAPEQTLAVTGVAPEGADKVRAGIWAQNRVSQVLPNLARVGAVHLAQLDAPGERGPRVEPISGLSRREGARSATLAVRADWPDGTAVTLDTTRGTVTPSVLLTGGRAEARLSYGEGDVGSTRVTATIAGRSSRRKLDDPYAATISLAAVDADGTESPALVQVVRDGKVLPGRYESIPGEFVLAPWSQELPPGHYTIRVSRGPQFEASERQADLISGGEVSLGRVALRRDIDLRALGWYGGDPDGDVYHGQRIYTDVTAETAARVARAVGLDWVTPANWGEPDPKTWREARAAMNMLSSADLLFRFADEKKWHTGHFCFVGLERPDGEEFGAYWDKIQRIIPAEALRALRDSGAATFANHPVRYWMSGEKNDKFVTNLYAAMPFDLCAAGLLDGININEGGEPALKLWALLLDHGYRVTATGGADFSLDHPGGWLPGLTRLYVHAPDGLSEQAIVAAIKKGRTVVSTGPMLVASIDEGRPPGTVVETSRPHTITARGWARRDRADRLRRVELWSHGQVIQARDLSGDGSAEEAKAQFDWAPSGDHDWVAVRLISESGWAMTSAFYAAAPGWEPPGPVTARVAVKVAGLGSEARQGASVEIWNNWPAAPGAKILRTVPVSADGAAEVDAPVTATIRLLLADGRRRDVRLYDASGVRDVLDAISQGAEKDAPLLRWETYADVLRRCRNVTVEFSF